MSRKAATVLSLFIFLTAATAQPQLQASDVTRLRDSFDRLLPRANNCHRPSNNGGGACASRADFLGGLVRLAFHDAAGTDAGADGCVDLNIPDNAGLGPIIDELEPTYSRFSSLISRADFWQLYANFAIEAALPPDAPFTSVPFVYGREDAATCAPVGEALPSSQKALEHVLEFFLGKGFSTQEIVALMGAHSIGRASSQNSGIEGRWDRTEAVLDNAYFRDIIDRPWVRQSLTTEGVGTNHFFVDPRRQTIMLNTDMALAFDIGTDDDVNENTCETRGSRGGGGGPRGRPECPFLGIISRPFVELYAEDQSQWLQDFRTAWLKLQHLGYDALLEVVGSDRL